MGGGSAPSIEQLEALSGDQQGLVNWLVGQLFPGGAGQRGATGEPILSGFEPYPGTVTPGLSLGQQAAVGYGGIATPWQTNTLRDLMLGEPAYTADPGAVERFYSEGIERPAETTFYRDTLPQIEQGLANRGLHRGPLAGRQMARAGEDFLAGLGGVRGDLFYQDEAAAQAAGESAADRSLGAISDYNAITSEDIQSRLAQGGLVRDVEGAGLGEDFQSYLSEQDYYNPWLGFLPQILGTQGYTYANVPGTPSQTGTYVSAGLGVLGLIAALASSRKVKVKVGDVDPQQILTKLIGLPLDRWQYHGVEVDHLGTYAEDFNAAMELSGGQSEFTGTPTPERIDVADMFGALLAGIQALAEQNRIDRRAAVGMGNAIEQLELRNKQLEKRVEQLDATLEGLLIVTEQPDLVDEMVALRQDDPTRIPVTETCAGYDDPTGKPVDVDTVGQDGPGLDGPPPSLRVFIDEKVRAALLRVEDKALVDEVT